MPTLPQPYNDQQVAQMKRVTELQNDGYIESVDQRWLLTDKGWRTLSAAADSKPQAPQRRTKAQNEAELHEWARSMIGIGGWWQSK